MEVLCDISLNSIAVSGHNSNIQKRKKKQSPLSNLQEKRKQKNLGAKTSTRMPSNFSGPIATHQFEKCCRGGQTKVAVKPPLLVMKIRAQHHLQLTNAAHKIPRSPNFRGSLCACSPLALPGEAQPGRQMLSQLSLCGAAAGQAHVQPPPLRALGRAPQPRGGRAGAVPRGAPAARRGLCSRAASHLPAAPRLRAASPGASLCTETRGRCQAGKSEPR